MAFGIAKGFGLELFMENALRENLSGQEEVLDYILKFSHSMLDTTKGGIIAGVGLIMLFWTIIKLIDKIENAFNFSWKVEKSRGWSQKLTDYTTIIITAPLLIILSSSITIFIKTVVMNATSEISFFEFATPILLILLKFVSYLIVWLLFTFIYYIIPFTKVEFKSALIAGIIAGTIFQLTQWIYINFQIGVGSYNAIYGSFAALPLFLIWLQTSWFITLLGVEFSVTIQNFGKIRFDIEKMDLSINQKNNLAILIVNQIIKNIQNNESPFSIAEISNKLKSPEFYVQNIVEELVTLKILAKANTDFENVFVYLPMFDINVLTVNNLINKISNNNNSNFEFEKFKFSGDELIKNLKIS